MPSVGDSECGACHLRAVRFGGQVATAGQVAGLVSPKLVCGAQATEGLAGHSSRQVFCASEGWCRGPDSNRRPRAYETRALTN